MIATKFATVALMIVVLVSLAYAPSAGAADGLEAVGDEMHCVVELAADGRGRLGPVRCFDDPDQALGAALGVRVSQGTTDDSAQLETLVESLNASAASNTLLSREYDGTGFSGSSLTYTTANTAGCNGTSYSDAQLDAWNNRIESVKAYGDCTVRHYDGYNFTGSSFACSSSCTSMGSMGNRTSSIRHS